MKQKLLMKERILLGRNRSSYVSQYLYSEKEQNTYLVFSSSGTECDKHGTRHVLFGGETIRLPEILM